VGMSKYVPQGPSPVMEPNHSSSGIPSLSPSMQRGLQRKKKTTLRIEQNTGIVFGSGKSSVADPMLKEFFPLLATET